MLLLIILLFLFFSRIDSQLRLCEAEGSCRHCSDNRYSYYRCRMQEDCFIGEVCDNGFCCPNMPPTFALQREPAAAKKNHEEVDEPCPDQSKWSRRCSKNEDCTHREELCIEGKCCKTCSTIRRQLLDNLRSLEIIGQAIPLCEEDGVAYRKRQCLAGTDVCWCVNRYGRRLSRRENQNEKQCETVRRRQENMALKAAMIIQEDYSKWKEPFEIQNQNTIKSKVFCENSKPGICPNINQTSFDSLIFDLTNLTNYCNCDSDCKANQKCCSIDNYHACLDPHNPNLKPTLSLVCGANEQYSACYTACQPSCQDPTTPPCPSPGQCQPGCVCMPGYIRRDGSPRSACVPKALCQAYDLTIKCADDRRQYHTCGSACPISCETRNQPRCNEKCVTGCFCKIPFILENSQDPLHSRCILPSDCTPLINQSPIVDQFVARNPQLATEFRNLQTRYPTTPLIPKPQQSSTVRPSTIQSVLPTLIPNSVNHCADPLKNYLNCGSKCPASCDRPLTQSASLECALSCVSGCFCRLPYVLLNSTDPNSSCILPQLCPRKSIQSSSVTDQSKICQDPRKEWSECGALQCARSCANPLGRCSSGQCASGCVCREPYVMLHPNDPTSRCVLPAECEKSCEDPAKEYIACGSSCPMGCDNRHPKHCTPCQTGCFCRNGLVFENSSTWHTSKCIKIEDCPAEINESTSTVATSTSPSTTLAEASERGKETTTVTTIIAKLVEKTAENNEDWKTSSVLSNACPATTYDVGGRGCNSNMDCPIEQRCCRPLIVSLGVSPQRCVCPDPHAVWSTCGTVCPEYCGQPSIPVCSSTCNAGCHCAPGFVRSRNDVTATCVPRESCATKIVSPILASSIDDVTHQLATIREIPSYLVPEPTVRSNEHEIIAVAIIISRDSSTIGRFTFIQITPSTSKIHGEVFNLPRGRHAVVIHQFGDASDGCSRVGPPFSRTENRLASLGDITEAGRFESIIDWPIVDMIGRAIVIYPFSTSEWGIRAHFGEKPLACGTVGIARVS